MTGFEGKVAVPKPNRRQTTLGDHKRFRMNVYRTIAIVGLVLFVITSAAFAADSTTPTGSLALPTTTATPRRGSRWNQYQESYHDIAAFGRAIRPNCYLENRLDTRSLRMPLMIRVLPNAHGRDAAD
jgi:hypothetical protein